jgi:phage tail-like protein
MTSTLKEPKKHLLDYLPVIYQESGPSDSPSFMEQFLIPFERLLLDFEWKAVDPGTHNAGVDIQDHPLEKKVSDLHILFDPDQTPEEFLPWLASWAALSFQPELSVKRRRRLLARIVPMYRIRGTRRYLEEILSLCLDAHASVDEAPLPALQIGTHSTVGADTCLGGGPPHFFTVNISAPKMSTAQIEAQCRLAKSLIELAKPAHTWYELEIASAELQLGVHSVIGVDTILASPS